MKTPSKTKHLSTAFLSKTFRHALAVLLLLISAPGFAQSLVVTSFEGFTVGYLLNKIPGSVYATYLTPQGDLLTMTTRGSTSNTMDIIIKRLLFEADDCSGDPWIDGSDSQGLLYGEVFQIGEAEDSLHARMPRSIVNLNKTMKSEKVGDGVCAVIVGDFMGVVVMVEEVDPATYGITESEQGKWRVKIPSFEFEQAQQSEVISCDSFESCPEL